MASLWSLVRKRQISYALNTFSNESARAIAQQLLTGPPPKLVNLSDFASTWDDDDGAFDMDAMDATPCFPRMWFEWSRNAERTAAFVGRHTLDEVAKLIHLDAPAPADARFFLQMVFLHEQNGAPVLRGAALFYIDRLGCLTGSIHEICTDDIRGHIATCALLVCEALTNINTQGTRIEPPFDSKPVQIVKPDRAPCSVWHTIHLPNFAHPPLVDGIISPEVLERREHWVRGHRRDYRRGAGMFGRVKALIWVPEFQRGNAELGTVQQAYEIRNDAAGRKPKSLKGEER